MAVVGFVVMLMIGESIKELPVLYGGPDDVAAQFAGLPWKAIDERLGKGTTVSCLLMGSTFGVMYEIYRWDKSRRE